MAERGRARTQGVAGTWPPREAAQAGGLAPSGLGTWPPLVAKSADELGGSAPNPTILAGVSALSRGKILKNALPVSLAGSYPPAVRSDTERGP